MSKIMAKYEISRPVLNGTLKYEQQDDQVMVYLEERPVWAVLNWVSYLLLSMCDGARRISELIDFATQLGGTDRPSTAKRVVGLFEYLSDIEMVHFVGGGPGEPLVSDIYFPLNIYLNITTRCNLRCPYCYADGGNQPSDELGVDQLAQVLESASQISNDVSIKISGGEPLLRPDIWEIATLCRGFGFEVNLLTNGTLVNTEVARNVKQHFDHVLISLDGPDAEHHDALRGQGTYRKSIQGYDNLLDAGCDLLVGTTITRLNIDAIPAMLDLPGMKPEMLSMNMLVASGRGVGRPDLRPTNDEILRLFQILHQHFDPTHDVPGFSMLTPSKLQYGGRCRLGRRIMSIAPNGDVYPCHALHRPELLAGNALERPLNEIFLQSTMIKECRRLTVDRFDRCRECELKYFCGGGCRADAYNATGSLTGTCSYCSLLENIVRTYMWHGAPREPVHLEELPGIGP